MPRLFGSVARGEDNANSDIDLLVDAGSNCTLLDLSQAQDDLEDRFGRRFDLVTINSLHPTIRSQAIAEAIAL
ncbi:nucleotidyltransferase family protein [Sphingomonas faeni]|uniref:nucleotidyltransferase family protein n=1 Tax=Sphingomonas faeni TaxID=185950 RepID=UPI003593BCA9